MIIFGCLSWMSGIMLGTLWEYSALWLLLCLSLILCFWHFPNTWIRYVCIFLLFLGWGWSVWSLSQIQEEKVQLGERVGWNGFSHHITGTVTSLLGVNEYNRRYKMDITQIGDTPYHVSVALIVPPNITLTPGDTVQAFGKFRFPEDTPQYAGEKMLWYRGMIAEFQVFQNSKRPPQSYGYTIRIREWLDMRLRELFPPSGYTLLSGILLGQRNALDSELKEQLKASGLMHLMVVSGGNIMMLIVFLSLFIRTVPVILRIGIICITVFGFALLVGGDMPVWRAALMGTIGYTAGLWGYSFSGLILPLAVAALLALWSPLSLLYDIGLQLSFLSVICIIVWSKKIAHSMRFLGDFFAEATALTLAATLGTLPITVFYFGTFSLIGPLANMLAAPVIPLLMYSGILTLFVSLFSSSGAIWIGYIPWIGTTYLMNLITFFGSQKWSSITLNITAYKDIFIILSLGVLTLAIITSQFRRKKPH